MKQLMKNNDSNVEEVVVVDQGNTIIIPPSKTIEYGYLSGWVHDEDSELQLYHRFMKRASTVSSVSPTATSSAGCVQCPDVSCPACGDNYACVMTSLTCKDCPLTYCVLKPQASASNSSSSSGPHKKSIGAVVGGVVGGVCGAIAVVVILYFLYFKKYYSKNRKSTKMNGEGKRLSKMILGGGTGKQEHDSSLLDGSVDGNLGSSAPPSSLAGGPGAIGLFSNGNDGQATDLGDFRPPQRMKQRDGINGKKNKFSDETSSVSTTAASNILPIAYIPGVKASASNPSLRTNGLSGLASNSRRNNLRKGKKTDDDAKSHITLGSSILGDFDDEPTENNNYSNSRKNNASSAATLFSEDSISLHDGVGNGTLATYSVGSLVSVNDNLVAIRARPNLVQIDEEEEEEEEEEEKGSNSQSINEKQELDSDATSNMDSSNVSTLSNSKNTYNSATSHRLPPTLQEEDEEDSDDDDSLVIELDVHPRSNNNSNSNSYKNGAEQSDSPFSNVHEIEKSKVKDNKDLL